jgi:hypothetical protein
MLGLEGAQWTLLRAACDLCIIIPSPRSFWPADHSITIMKQNTIAKLSFAIMKQNAIALILTCPGFV